MTIGKVLFPGNILINKNKGQNFGVSQACGVLPRQIHIPCSRMSQPKLDHVSGEPDERLAKKRFIMASPADVGEVAAVRPDLAIPEQHVAAAAGEDVDCVAMPKASCQ